MTDIDELVGLDPQVEIGQTNETVLLSNISAIPEGTKLAIKALEVPEPLFVYIVVLPDQDDADVAILYRGTAQLVLGTKTRIPDAGYLTSPITGELRVIGCAHVVEDEAWDQLLDGRDPDTKHGGTKESHK